MHIVADREMPAWQCTRSVRPDSLTLFMNANDSLKMVVMSQSPESRMGQCLYSNLDSSISGYRLDTFRIASIPHLFSQSVLVAWYSDPR